jgi:hypothetical protein
MKKTQYILPLFLLLTALPVVAQNSISKDSKSKKIEFGANVFYGLAGLTGTLPGGTISPEMNAQFSLESSYFLTNTLGIGAGVGIANYSSKIQLNSYSSSTNLTDDGGDNFKYLVDAKEMSESDKISALEIPLFLTYRLKSDKVYFESNAGLKASIPISSQYNYTGGSATTTGYYEKYDIVLSDMPEHGFQTYSNLSLTGKLLTNTSLSVFAKVGIVIPVKVCAIHVGLYGSYGLNPVLKSQSDQLFGYPNTYSPLSSLSSKISLISGGLKIGISL